ncbi:C6 transcription factor RegA [Talaromyces stipitatus ATCC 10500]|uniref:C6 transcription factor RegA n=1 Tax=Talaromyces stipitatus (strain ATCC 10500 / CBS 375.48 / QM 6759 / NRRL 1006) TaxID=441959 RepID=B8LWM3_TALSN|nr:C6 transcription factor RegA [Talaromyces stipitatus ATCC 10500]EED24420.1 C6 transcription factor RegA [Talaromyces stipitatus ATCC 10500]
MSTTAEDQMLPTVEVSSTGGQPNLYQCGKCSQTYKRIDHLSRHVRTHTQEKPYRCHVCPKKFGRIDLLSRHSTLHNTNRDDSSSSRKRRRGPNDQSIPVRTSQACVACAENHLRCDDNKPCGRCQRREIVCRLPAGTNDVSEPSGHLRQNTTLIPDTSSSQDDRPSHPQVGKKDNNWLAEHSGGSEQVPESLPLVSAEPPLALSLSEQMHSLGTGGLEHHDAFLNTFPSSCPSGIRTPHNLISFGLETDLDLSIVDLSFLESYNSRNPFEFGELPPEPLPLPSVTTPEINIEKTGHPASLGKLLWRFVPAPQDHGLAEHDNLLLPDQTESNPTPQSLVEVEHRTTAEKLDLSSRDKILGIFLRQMKQPNISQAVSFPSVDLLDSFIQYYLTAPFSNVRSWLHLPTLNFRKSRSELLLGLAAAGAVLAPDLALRKLGYAMHEVLRIQLTAAVEEDNTAARNLEMHQGFYLYLDIGLWSGNSRKIEIAESIQKMLVTMMRRGGWFYRSAYSFIPLQGDETGHSMEEQWRSWVRQESFKRLAIQLFQHDAQTSMAILSPPLISYSEISVPLPATSALWNANSAFEWHDLYCEELASMGSMHLPTVMECVANLDVLDLSGKFIDQKVSCEAVIHAFWGIVREYRQFDKLLKHKARYWDNGLVLTSRYQELTRILDYCRIAYEPESALTLHVVLLNMHVSLEDVQFLIAAEPQICHPARASLSEWANQKESRQALWHAGQIIKHIKLLPVQGLRDFAAIALHMAGMTLWAYGSLSQGPDFQLSQKLSATQNLEAQEPSAVPYPLTSYHRDGTNLDFTMVYLDGVQSDDVNRYIAFERGTPVLKGYEEDAELVYIHHPRAVLHLMIELMEQNYRRKASHQPPLVANLIRLIEKQLDEMQ